MKTYKEYCKEWIVGCLTSYKRVEWKVLVQDVKKGATSLLTLFVCPFVPLLSILFPFGAILLKYDDKKYEEAVENAKKKLDAALRGHRHRDI